MAISRVGGAAGTFLLPVVMDLFGTSAALGGCFLALMVGGIVCQRYAPETSPQILQKRLGNAQTSSAKV